MDGHWITSPEAEAAIGFAAAGGDPLALSEALGKRFGLAPEQRAAVLTQVDLRARAARRWGIPVDDLWLTRDGLEQASRPAVAAWRARRLADAGVRTIADLGCGLGLESRAFAAAGMQVTAIELDAEVAVFAAANLRGTDAQIVVGDLTVMDLPECDAYFVDPARRDPSAPRSIDGLSGQRVADPEHWSPPWSWVCALDKPRVVAKVAPGIAHDVIPDSASVTWVQCDGDLVEASVWFGELAAHARRTSIAIVNDVVVDEMNADDDERADVGTINEFLYDVNGVVTRAGLVTQLAAPLGAHRIDERLGFLSSPTLVHTVFASAYRVVESMPFDAKRVVDALRKLDAGNLTIVKRAFAADTELLRTQWMRKLNGTQEFVVVLTRIGDQPTAIITRALSRP